MRTSHAGALMPHIPPVPFPAVLMMHFNGTPGSAVFTDSSVSAHPLTAFGNAQLSSAQSLALTSGKFDGTDDYVTGPNSTDFNFGAGDFTVEFFVWVDPANGSNSFVFGNFNFGGADGGFFMTMANNAPLAYFSMSDGSTAQVGGPSSMTFSAWHHVAFVRSGTAIRLYIDGGRASINAAALALSVKNSPAAFYVGGTPLSPAYPSLTGYLEDLRVTRLALYSGDTLAPGSCFTVPSVPLLPH